MLLATLASWAPRSRTSARSFAAAGVPVQESWETLDLMFDTHAVDPVAGPLPTSLRLLG